MAVNKNNKGKKNSNKRNNNGGGIILKFFVLGIFLFLIGIIVGLWFSSSNFQMMASSIGAPKFANEAKSLLDSVLVDTRCSYKSYAKRHFILCSREGMSMSKDGYWKSSSGLWEAQKRNKPVKFIRNTKSSTRKVMNEKTQEYISYRIHPVDEKAIYLTRYLLDPQLIGPPSHVTDIASIRNGVTRTDSSIVTSGNTKSKTKTTKTKKN